MHTEQRCNHNTPDTVLQKDWIQDAANRLYATEYRWLITLAFAALIVFLSVTPRRVNGGPPTVGRIIDHTPALLHKFMHVVCYAVLAMLAVWTLEPLASQTNRIMITLLATIGFGAFLEWQQTRVPGRFGTIFDVLLNTLGALVGIVLVLFVL